MADITTINTDDRVKDSRAVINTNFENLNTDKVETLNDLGLTETAEEYNTAATNAITTDQKAALAGGGGLGTPSASNKFLTEESILTGFSKKIATNTNTTELPDNTTSEQTIWSTTLTGGLLGTNNVVRFKTYVSNITGDSNTAVDPVFRLKYGATTVATFTLQQGSDTNALSGYIEGVLMANGSTSAQKGTLYMFAHEEVLALSTNTGTPDVVSVLATGTSTELSTSDLTLQLTIQWGNAQTNNDFIPAGTIIELIS